MIATPTIIIADDHPLFRSALSSTLDRVLDHPNVIEAQDFNSLQNCLDTHSGADLILLDLSMPGTEGFSALVFLTAHFPQVPIMIVSAHEEPEIMRRAIDHGANGFLPKSASIDIMTQALTAVLEGGLWVPDGLDNTPHVETEELSIAEALANLTPQQFRVATMVCQGLLNKQIAYELSVTEATIKAHMTEIFRKLGVHSRTQAALAIERLSVSPASNLDEFKKEVFSTK